METGTPGGDPGAAPALGETAGCLCRREPGGGGAAGSREDRESGFSWTRRYAWHVLADLIHLLGGQVGLQVHQHADLAAGTHVGNRDAVGEAGKAADLDVLADDQDHLLLLGHGQVGADSLPKTPVGAAGPDALVGVVLRGWLIANWADTYQDLDSLRAWRLYWAAEFFWPGVFWISPVWDIMQRKSTWVFWFPHF